MVITNRACLVSHGDREGRDLALQLLEAGLAASDPYVNTRALIRIEGDWLLVGGHPEMDVSGYGDEVIDLRQIEHIYVIGAGKAVQRQAKALEDLLGERLTAGAITIKYGEAKILERIEVTYGAHPVPDEGSLAGTRKMIEITDRVTSRDLVFTVFSDGASSLTPLPMPGITLDDLHALYRLAIKFGSQGIITQPMAYFSQAARGRLLRRIHPARSINLIMQVGTFPRWRGQVPEFASWVPTWPPGQPRMAEDLRLFQREPWWPEFPASMKAVLERCDPAYEVPALPPFKEVAASYWQPIDLHQMMEGARVKAEALGIQGVVLASYVSAHAAQAANVLAAIAKECENYDRPFQPPVALITSGHLEVPTGNTTGLGGRNQEFALRFAQLLGAGLHQSQRIVVAAMDSDGTDGPGRVDQEGLFYCAAGGVVDGQSAQEALARGLDLAVSLANHDATPALLAMDSAIHTGNTGTCLGDLRVVLVR